MAEGGRPVYCPQCGSIVQAGDRFCGVCGTSLTSEPREAGPTEETPTLVRPPADVPPRGRNRALIGGVAVAALLVIVLAGAGAMALTGFGPFAKPSGNPDGNLAPSGSSDSPEESNESSIDPDSPPDPAFDSLFPDLTYTTIAPIMLPARLPETMGYPAVDVNFEGDGYSVPFFIEPTEPAVEGWSNAEVLGVLRVYPDDEDLSNQYFGATRVEQVELPDGTEATLRYLEPAGRPGTQGPYREGKFDKDGFTYVLTVLESIPTDEEVKLALSSMVEVPRETGSTGDTGEEDISVPEEPREGGPSAEQRFISEYYDAVDREDWAATYSMLDSESQEPFGEEGWAQVQALREAEAPIPPIESAIISYRSGLLMS